MEPTNPRRRNAGQFKPGPDQRRHRFTREECQAGFWAAVTSIVLRYPDAIDSSGRHMAFDFLKAACQHNKEKAE
jgi:hypothetical protein